MKRCNCKFGLVVGASNESIHAITVAKELGLYTVAVDGNPHAKGFEVADEKIVVDITQPEKILSALEGKKPLVVIPVPIGRYLISSAALNDKLNLRGVSLKAAEYCTDKFLFHTLLNKEGLREADCFLIKDFNDIPKKSKLKFPMILKPRFGSGSRNVFVVNEYENIRMLLQDKLDEDFILETLIDAEEYALDAAMISNKFYPVLLRKKLNTSYPYRQCVGYFSINPLSRIFATATSVVEKIARLIGIDNSVMHIDMICDGCDLVFPIEISARPSGHNLHDIFTPITTGVDIVREYLNFALGNEFNFMPNFFKQTAMHFFDFEKSELINMPNADELKRKYNLLAYKNNMYIGQKFGIVKDDGVLERGFFILQERSAELLKEKIISFLKEFKTSKI